MADNKLIFQFKWLNLIFHRWLLDCSQLFCRLDFRSRQTASVPFFSLCKGPCPPHAGSLVPDRCYTKVMALTCQFLKVCPAPYGPLSAFIAAQQSRQSLIEYEIRAG